MQIVVQKWGNSLGIRIPNLYVKEFDLRNGSSVEIIEESGKLVIVPKRLSLDELLSKISSENLHNEVSTGSIVGVEEW
jgi:antitoxin MazE